MTTTSIEKKDIKNIIENTKNHFLQSDAWKEVRKVQGNDIYEAKGFWIQINKVPLLGKFGYVPKLDWTRFSTQDAQNAVNNSGCFAVRVDPLNCFFEEVKFKQPSNFFPAKNIHPKETLLFDLTKSVEELYNDVRPPHRQYFRRAEKKGVTVNFDSKDSSFNNFLQIYSTIQKRYGFTGRSTTYLKKVWKTLKKDDQAIPVIVTSVFEGKPIVAWFSVIYKNVFYAIYGGSIEKGNGLKASYLHAWKSMLWAKENNCKVFDFWGLTKDKETGYSRYKLGFGGIPIEYLDSIDIVSNKFKYLLFKFASYFKR